jgi:hypothetical protein
VIDWAITPGRTGFEAAEATLVSVALLVAVTVKVYWVPLVRPVTVHGDAVHPVE